MYVSHVNLSSCKLTSQGVWIPFLLLVLWIQIKEENVCVCGFDYFKGLLMTHHLDIFISGKNLGLNGLIDIKGADEPRTQCVKLHIKCFPPVENHYE